MDAAHYYFDDTVINKKNRDMLDMMESVFVEM